MPEYNANLATQTVTDKPVLAPSHPPVVRTYTAKAANGVLDSGLLASRNGSGEVVPYKNAVIGSVGTGDGIETAFAGTLGECPVLPGSVSVSDGVETFADSGFGQLTGSAGGAGTVNYSSGAVAVTFNAAPANAADIATSHANRLFGVVIGRTDTAQEQAVNLCQHGTVVGASLTVFGGGLPTTADKNRLAAIGIFCV